MLTLKELLLTGLKENQIFQNEPMKLHTSFKLGGNADILTRPESIEEILFILEICKNNNIPYYIMGNGTNLIVKDNGFRGIIIQLFKNFSNVTVKNNIITAQSGALLSYVSNFALKNSLKSMEFASGIPGTIGGAVCMNAGAYDGEMKNIVDNIKVIHNGKILKLSNEEACFGYRKSKIQTENMTVISVDLKLENGVFDEIKQKMNDFNKKRADKQPIDIPSAGSTFKRPEGYFAGKLIMDSGLKGFRIGGASVSEKHCGFIVNDNNASAEDVCRLINYVKETVFKKFNVMLETEIKIIGE